MTRFVQRNETEESLKESGFLDEAQVAIAVELNFLGEKEMERRLRAEAEDVFVIANAVLVDCLGAELFEGKRKIKLFVFETLADAIRQRPDLLKYRGRFLELFAFIQHKYDDEAFQELVFQKCIQALAAHVI